MLLVSKDEAFQWQLNNFAGDFSFSRYHVSFFFCCLVAGKRDVLNFLFSVF